MSASESTPVEPYNVTPTTKTTATAPSSTSTTATSTTPATSTPSTPAPSTQPTPTPNIVLHHLEDSRSQRILWLLEELAVPYTIKRYSRTKSGLAPAELLAVHPLGKSPVITDSGRTVAESGCIVDYLLETYGGGRFDARTYDDRLAVKYWSHMSEGSLMPPLVMLKVFAGVREKAPWLVRPVASGIANAVESAFINPTVQHLFDFIERHVKQQRANKSDFFVGEGLTAADFMMLFPLEAAKVGRGSLPLGEETKVWVDRMHARDAYKMALQKGGEYAYAKM